MVKRTFRMLLTMLVFTALGAVAPSASAAQFSPEDILKRLKGIETAYVRKYISDRELGFAAPVTATSSTPDVLLVTVLEFESNDQATAAFNGMMNRFLAGMIIGETGIDLTESSLDGVGDQAMLYTGVSERLEGPEHKALLAVQDDNLGFLITAHGGDDSTPEMMRAVAAFMIEAEPGAQGISMEGDTVTGGTFDIMPGRDEADILRGLIPMYEYDLLRDGGNHPLQMSATTSATSWFPHRG